ncbi:serine/threonine protein kinase [Microbulbifer spongiae]|uniref:Serine/threonine protein kinase n=1 Tax=Microbulbifer spongiae TaxID=2944933 RepID=A0ABY9EGC8_9GAMM|nr:serine/threonine protein kinase [Microbulbifer sp. MI-G]WKD51153.1 serine/threonine protein kinase [Microbulbifer sp. MI-G]
MKRVQNRLLLVAVIAALMAGCDSGGINIEPTTVDNSTNTGGGTNTPVTSYDGPCASYEQGDGTIVHGDYNESKGNCEYQRDFVDAGNPLMHDITLATLATLADGGAHVFIGSLVIGQNYDSHADMQAAGITQGGDGTKLTIEPGVTVAFNSAAESLVINRGSQIFAVGTSSAPITVTSLSDVNGEISDPEAVGEWGGMVVNGFGVTNKCEYTGSVDDGDLAMADGECNVDVEGLIGDAVSNYGGENNADNSGKLSYFRVKHTGFDVVPGNELNGITFGAVGSGTVLENIQAYSTQDDGVEFFGGAVNMTNYVAMFVNDDSIDIDEGYRGTITNSLVIQGQSEGANCIESDGIGSYSSKDDDTIQDFIARGLNSRPTIDGLTCIISPVDGSDDPGAGWRFREAIFPTVINSMVVATFNAADTKSLNDNYCLRIDNEETLQGAEDGDIVLESNIFVCEEKTNGDALPGGQTIQAWAVANENIFADVTGAVDPTANTSTNLQVLQGATLPIFSVNIADMVVNDVPITITPKGNRAYLGALSESEANLDWTRGWAVGLDKNLWIAN